MKLLTKDYKVVEGRLITEAESIFIEEVNDGISGLVLYSHQKKEFIQYMLTKYVIQLRYVPEVVFVEEPLIEE